MSSAALSDRECHRGDPRGVHERKRNTFGDDRDVVGMRQPSIGPPDTPRAPGTTTMRVFHCGPSVADAPPPQALRGRRPASASRAREGTVGRRTHHLGPPRRQQAGVQRNHERVLGKAHLVTTVGQAPGHIAFRHEQFDEPFGADGQDQQRDTRTLSTDPSSPAQQDKLEQNPGPIAISIPHDSWSGVRGASSVCPRRTCSTSMRTG